MRWHDFEADAPKLAALGRERLGEPGVVLVATTRADGLPRVSPVEPLFWNGELWLSMLWGSRKAMDLQRDARVLVHSIVTDPQATGGEYKVRGRAIVEADPSVHEGFAADVRRRIGWNPEPGRFHLFRVDVEDVTFIRWDGTSNTQFVSRWPAREEFVRRGTSDTSVGDPEPFSELF